ncbi:hypothetical protein Leryth_004946 [Lithospermum erythrorhizon]|nr:hypothetical protein Leryth_004946 [Lithospermum erythrorhizon]
MEEEDLEEIVEIIEDTYSSLFWFNELSANHVSTCHGQITNAIEIAKLDQLINHRFITVL